MADCDMTLMAAESTAAEGAGRVPMPLQRTHNGHLEVGLRWDFFPGLPQVRLRSRDNMTKSVQVSIRQQIYFLTGSERRLGSYAHASRDIFSAASRAHSL
jgi:hypothetical protein